jgi:TPR repeat protein
MHLAAKHVFAISVCAIGCAVAGAQAGTSTTPSAQDPQAVASLLQKAHSGDVPAQILVGERFLAGDGVERDCKQAGDWFRKAAEKNALAGEMRLAAYYRDGAKGCPRDMEQAAIWYRKAADQGEVTAQGILATLYSYGQGVTQNYVEAYFWLDVAASAPGPEQSHYAANRQMVGVHLTTDEVEEVQQRVAKWKATHPH